MSRREPQSNTADINAANSQFWKREIEEIEQLFAKYPDAYAEAVDRAIALEPAIQIVGAQIGVVDDDKRQGAMSALLKAAAVADVHAQMRAVEPTLQRDHARARENANRKRRDDADARSIVHFHGWQLRAAASLEAMDLGEQVEAYCARAECPDRKRPRKNRRLFSHEKVRIKRLLQEGRLRCRDRTEK
jgi:hypothetical protein